MRILVVLVLLIVLILIAAEVYLIFDERGELKEKTAELNKKFDSLIKDNENLKSEIEYFSFPENLEKELRQRFNYKKIGEKMIIITQ